MKRDDLLLTKEQIKNQPDLIRAKTEQAFSDEEIDELVKWIPLFTNQASLKTAKAIRELVYDFENMPADRFDKKWGNTKDKSGFQMGVVAIIDKLIKEIENDKDC